MTADDRPRFAEGIGLLASMLPPRKVLSDLLMEGYWWALKDMDLEAFTAAVHAAMKGCKFLPTPSELREQLARTLPAPGENDHEWQRKRFEAAFAVTERNEGQGLLTPASVHPSIQALIDEKRGPGGLL